MAQPTQPVQTKPAQPVAQPAKTVPATAQQPAVAGAAPVAQPPTKKKKWWIWVIVAVVVIAILVGLAYLFL